MPTTCIWNRNGTECSLERFLFFKDVYEAGIIGTSSFNLKVAVVVEVEVHYVVKNR